jgi:release factor glutamine methyltransferase
MNVQRHGVADRVRLVEGDLFGPVSGQMFDLIVSNPPYIADAEFAALDVGVRNFEPRSALAGGPDGLDFYRRIAADVVNYVSPGGVVMVEIGVTQEAAVRELFAAHLEPGPTFKDPGGRPRVVTAKRRSGS